MFKQLCLFKKENNHLQVPYLKDSLGRWVSTQRKLYKKNSIDLEKIELLDGIGFIWDVDEYTWNSNFEKLKMQYDKIGHSIVTRSHSEDQSLATWCLKQKSEYNKGILCTTKIDKLNSIKFPWDVRDIKWMEHYNQLVELYNTSHNYTKLGNLNKTLLQWCNRQRRAYKKGLLSEDKIQLLSKINFTLCPDKDKWLNKYNPIKELYLEYNNLDFLKLEKYKDMAKWLQGQKERNKNGQLTNLEKKLLSEITYDLTIVKIDKLWNEKYNEVHKLVKEDVTISHKEHPQLSSWIYAQRKKFKLNKLNSEQVSKLSNIGVITITNKYVDKNPNYKSPYYNESKEIIWNENYEKLCYYMKNNITITQKIDKSLYNWTLTQKRLFKQNKLRTDRCAKLKEIDSFYISSEY